MLSHLPYRVAGLELITGRPEGTPYRPGETVEVTVRVTAVRRFEVVPAE